MLVTHKMKLVFFAVLLGVVGALANKGSRCTSGKFTTSGECCKQCQPGEGVVKECEVTQTVCAPCVDSETFSENFSHTEKCQRCTQCTGLMRMETPCTDANDAICACNYGYYMNSLTQRCEHCTRCPEGQGMLNSCEMDHDTVCEECTIDTYSDQESSREPCMPCSTCDESEVVQECSPTSDTICMATPTVSPYPFVTSPMSTEEEEEEDDGDFFVDPPLPLPTESTTTTTGGDSPQLIYQGLNDKLIPVYCSILAAGVGGLVAFIIFKRWNNCKQNKQGANNCTANPNQTPSPEGEKLHSDSGISVDSQSLQEQQGQTQTHTVLTMDEEPCLLLPLHTREKVEQLLFRGSDGNNCNMDDSDWSNLAGLLGYEEERIATFRQEDHPVRALLSDWAGKDNASIDALCAALRKINRKDIAQSLVLGPNVTKPTATSVV